MPAPDNQPEAGEAINHLPKPTHNRKNYLDNQPATAIVAATTAIEITQELWINKRLLQLLAEQDTNP